MYRIIDICKIEPIPVHFLSTVPFPSCVLVVGYIKHCKVLSPVKAGCR